ncbi:phage tail tube protein [Terasakiella sp. A23]|uniref:phage tail tube protein n=1 Tax=Terasakiella sp. FCG-A23 TaxID=3080561 RepID=UPI00295548AE|nr:phage tail tube protein [Terasakiella sp. A23]MDV7340971.1 phage tail tube protein [Terasakiella sp. A23]
MSDIFGTATITAEGEEFESVPGSAKLKRGLKTGKARKSWRGFVGSSAVVNMSEVTLDIVPTNGTDLEAFADGKIVSIVFEDQDSGQGWVISKATMEDEGELTDGDEALYSGVKFVGSKAEKA